MWLLSNVNHWNLCLLYHIILIHYNSLSPWYIPSARPYFVHPMALQGDAICNEVHPGGVPRKAQQQLGDFTHQKTWRMKSSIESIRLEHKMEMDGDGSIDPIFPTWTWWINSSLEIPSHTNRFGAKSRVPGSWPMAKIIIKRYRSRLRGMAWDIFLSISWWLL